MKVNPSTTLRIDGKRSQAINNANSKINLSIFKSRDIRGIYPSELNEEIAYKIGRAFVVKTRVKEVAIGRDMRLSSPALFQAFSKGVLDQGANVFDLGEVPVEYLYFMAGMRNGFESGVMITASHNPKEHNGFKMVKKRRKIVEVERGKDLISIIKKNKFPEPKNEGKMESVEFSSEFIEHIFSFIDKNKIKPLKIAVDAGNGMAGKIIPLLAEKLPLEILPLNFILDGNFPAHASNPLVEGASDQVAKTVVEERADFGFMFDGDADRIFLIDESGNFIKGDTTLLLLAKYLLKKYPGKGIAYNLICSKATPEFIKKWGGKPLRTAVGVAEVRESMMKKDGIMGGELSGHYLFQDNFYLDSGFVVFLILLEIISESNKKVSELIKELSPYVKAAEINFKVCNKEKILKEIKKKYSDGKQDFLDGITVDYDNWWFNIRPSQTESLLRLTMEAQNQPLLEEKKKELIHLIEKTAF